MGEAAQAQTTVVVIDDDHAMRLSCGKILAKMGLSAETFEDGARGLEGVARLKPDIVLVDLMMPGITGMEVITRIHDIDPEIIIIVITGYATIDTAVEAMKCGAYDFLPKPFSPDEVRLIIDRGLERRRLALESRRLEVERSLLKRRFVTFVSHQLQTPLAAIHQYLDVLKHLDDTAEAAVKRREWTDRCLKRAEELQGMIKDWLTLAKVECDTLSARRVKIDLNGVITDILSGYAEMAAAERVTLAADLPKEPCWVAGDPNCVAVVFDNLISNAIKYNKPGGTVTVTARVEGGEAVVCVSDTGVGIPRQYHALLFEEFFRVKGEGAKKTAGTGLGLHISRKIVAEMGGKIEVESEVGSGSSFRVHVPEYRDAT